MAHLTLKFQTLHLNSNPTVFKYGSLVSDEMYFLKIFCPDVEFQNMVGGLWPASLCLTYNQLHSVNTSSETC